MVLWVGLPGCAIRCNIDCISSNMQCYKRTGWQWEEVSVAFETNALLIIALIASLLERHGHVAGLQ